MNALTNFDGERVETHQSLGQFGVDETHWGYAIRARNSKAAHISLKKALAWFVGASLMVATLGLWALPGSMIDGDTFVIKTGLTAIFFAFAALAFWLSSRGRPTEIQIDVARGEVRSVARARSGETQLLERVAFADIGAVFVIRARQAAGQVQLVMRLECAPHVLKVASGPEAEIEALRTRIERDIAGHTRATLKRPKPSIFGGARRQKAAVATA